jgi:hypothetical protein
VAKLRCVCGYSISISGPIPNPNQWHCLSDVDLDSLSGQVDTDDIYMNSILAYRCPNSGHLWIFWKGLDENPSLYTPAEASFEVK